MHGLPLLNHRNRVFELWRRPSATAADSQPGRTTSDEAARFSGRFSGVPSENEAAELERFWAVMCE